MARKKEASRAADGVSIGSEYQRAVIRGILVTAQSLANKSSGSIGRRRLVNFLRGNQLPPRNAMELVSMSTFGLLASHAAAWVEEAVDRLVEEGFLTLVPWQNGSPGGIAISPSGVKALGDGTTIPDGVFPTRPRLGENPEVEERLRILRGELAAAEGLPRYGIFPNTALAALASKRPKTIAELAEIPGLGESRVRKYGKKILAAMK